MKRKNLHKHLLYYQWYLSLLRKLKLTRLNKRQTTLYNTLDLFLENTGKHGLITKANGVAFSFTLAIFPSIIFIFTLIPYIHSVIPHIGTDSIMSFLASVMPEAMYEAATGTIHDIVSNKRQGLLSFGALLALILATNGMHGLMSTFNSIYKTNEKRGFFRTRLIATGLTLVLSSVLFFSIILMVIGKIVLNFLSTEGFITQDYIIYLLTILKYFVIVIAFFIAISTIYYFAPAIHDRWRFFSAGAVFSAVACVATSYAFSFYINNFSNYNKLYGSLGMLIALMVWLYLLSLILLVGFEYNASVDRAVVSDKIENTTSIFD